MKLDPGKLAHLARGIDSMAERIDYWTSERMPAPLVVRRADKQWDESKHPRGPDGKFIEGEGAAAASAAEYLAQQAKAGKKATPNGMMQHMLLNGGITKQEIWDTTKANFEMSPSLNNYVSAVAATMKKKGIDVPEPPKAKKGGDKPAAEKKEDKPKADPGAEDAPAETEQSKKEAAAFGKAIDATTVATDISEHALDIKYAADKGLITAEQHDALKKKMQAKATELAGQATLPKPQNVHQDDIHWMATKSSYPPAEKAQYIAEMKVSPQNQAYKDLALALLGAKPSTPAAPGATLPEPGESPHQQTMHQIASDPNVSLEGKMEQLKEEWKHAKGTSNKDYALALMNAVSGGNAPDPELTTVSPPVGETSIPLPNNASSEVQKKMHATATDPSLTTAEKIENLKVLHAGLASAGNQQYAADLIAALGGKLSTSVAPAPPVVPKPLAQTQALQTELADLKGKWKGILPVNKPPVDAMEQALDKALSMATSEEQAQALSQITPIASPVGMGQKSANEFLAKAQQAAGITPTTAGHPSNAPLSSSLPKGPGKKLQSEIFHALEDSPAVYIETVAKFEGAGGKIKARNVVDTDRIPKDAYAKITAAYGAQRDDGMTQAVDKAMEEYVQHSFDKLDEDTKEAVRRYQGTDYGKINGALLAGSEGTDQTKKWIQSIRNAIDASVIPADTPAYRGMRCTLKDLSGFDDPAKSVGRAFVHKNFASISRSESKARDFGQSVMLKMVVPAGTRGLVMDKQNWEREIMLQANSVFRIDKVEQKVTASGKAQHLVHVTYMGTKEDG